MKRLGLAFAAAVMASACWVNTAEDIPPASSEQTVTAAVEDKGSLVRQPILVELFTSEGCSSCPPADRQLALLENEQPVAGADIITLAFHVDYWNRLGWTDKYSSPQFSERQNSYVQRMGLDSSYTPQMVVDGQLEFVGSDANKANSTIAKAAAVRKARVSLKASAESVELLIDDLDRHEDATVYLAVAEDGLVTDVKSGENGGSKLPHISVVRRFDVLGRIDKASSSFKASAKVVTEPGWKVENLKYVVFVQEDVTGKVVGVAKSQVK